MMMMRMESGHPVPFPFLPFPLVVVSEGVVMRVHLPPTPSLAQRRKEKHIEKKKDVNIEQCIRDIVDVRVAANPRVDSIENQESSRGQRLPAAAVDRTICNHSLGCIYSFWIFNLGKHDQM